MLSFINNTRCQIVNGIVVINGRVKIPQLVQLDRKSKSSNYYFHYSSLSVVCAGCDYYIYCIGQMFINLNQCCLLMVIWDGNLNA